MTAFTIRTYEPRDLDALREICVRTGLRGGDARGHYRDPEILPTLFAEPYAVFDPDLVFVADDGERAVGYIVGTDDSVAHAEALRDRWLPSRAARFPAPEGPAKDLDDVMRGLLHDPMRFLTPGITEEYPAHLHIDLLPHAQRRGLGRRLMTAFLDALRERDVPAVHLAMDPANTNARAFYERVGFTLLPQPEGVTDVIFLGIRLS
ncbi:GNAT family N-acetyltransferase [Streptomyces sp. 4N509B]|uniref:GNAT family N-acetyltransferase n=1 Tax=Streptomyces sp. 4N509B TaxID=3457413 RepID=UPI003FCFBEA5